MPPRFAYWTILVDNRPTAFRAATIEDIMPTFNRLKEKQPTAVLRWFQQGQLWNTPLDAREALLKRREQGRKRGRPRTASPGQSEKLTWTPKGEGEARKPARPDWKARPPGPMGAGSGARPPQWKTRPSGHKPAVVGRERPAGVRPEWKPPPKGPTSAGERPAWRPKGETTPRPRPSGSGTPDADRRSGRPEWTPKPAPGGAEAKQPPASRGERRDRTWRPGGDHKDPRQKYKDAKKAKWTRFKQAVRARSGKRKP